MDQIDAEQSHYSALVVVFSFKLTNWGGRELL
jgi:hypothetical protein